MKKLHIALFLSLVALWLCFSGAWTLTRAQVKQAPKGKPPQAKPAQPPEEEEDDYTEEDHADFMKRYQEPDLAKRADLLIQFLKTSKSNTLKQSAVGAYQAILNEYEKRKDYKGQAAAADKYLQLGRDFVKALDAEGKKAKTSKEIGAENLYLVSLETAATAYEKLGDNKNFIPYALKIYAEKPNAITAFHIYSAYVALKDTPKIVEWAEKTLQHNPDPKIRLDIRLDLVKRYAEGKKFDQASKYAREVLKDLDTVSKPDNVSKAEWDKFVTDGKAKLHGILGETAYEKSQWREAIAEFQEAVKYQKCNDLFYYRIGFAYWRMEDHKAAMHNFAKAYLLKGQTSADAKRRVEEIYKPFHNGTIIGLDKNVIHPAAAELGNCPKK
jgi:tetratricopeptide (TPR) repeat protein